MPTLAVTAQSYAASAIAVDISTRWTPARIATKLWLDASDQLSVTHASNSVSGWDDKSGNSYDASQATAGNRPTRVAAGQNSLDVISFGSTRRLSGPSNNLLRNVASALVFCVYKHDTAPTTVRTPFYVSTTGANTDRLWISSNTSGYVSVGGRRLDADSAPEDGGVTAAPLDDAWHIVAGAMNYDAARADVYLDGEIGTPNTGFQTAGVTSNTASAVYRVGSEATAQYLTGRVAEIIVIHSATPDALREVVEGYLAWKWGLEGNLISGHTYESAPPAPDAFVGVYTLSATSASYALALQTVRLASTKLAVTTATFVVTAQPVRLRATHLRADTAMFVVASPGVALARSVRLSASSSSYAATAVAVLLRFSDYTMVVTVAAYVVTASSARLWLKQVTAAVATFVLSGGGIGFLRHARVSSSVASYVVGTPTTLVSRALRLILDSMDYGIDGEVVNLSRRAAVVVERAVFTLTAIAVATRAGRVLSAIPRYYDIVRNNIGLTVVDPSREMPVVTRAYSVVSPGAGLYRQRTLSAAVRSYAATTGAATLLRAYAPAVATQSYAAASVAVGLKRSLRLACGTASFGCTAQAVALRPARSMAVSAASIVCSAVSAALGYARKLYSTTAAYVVGTAGVNDDVNRRLLVTSASVVVHFGALGANWFRLDPQPALYRAGFALAPKRGE